MDKTPGSIATFEPVEITATDHQIARRIFPSDMRCNQIALALGIVAINAKEGIGNMVSSGTEVDNGTREKCQELLAVTVEQRTMIINCIRMIEFAHQIPVMAIHCPAVGNDQFVEFL